VIDFNTGDDEAAAAANIYIYIYIYRPYRNVLQSPSDDEQKETKWGR
jgi:hypothetical protein